MFSDIIIISENSPGVGGFGTNSYDIFTEFKRVWSSTKLCYVDHVLKDVINTNRSEDGIFSFYLKDYYPTLNKILNKTYEGDQLTDLKCYYDQVINDTSLLLVRSPLMVGLMGTLYPHHQKIYYCSSLNIVNYEKYLNLFECNKSILQMQKNLDFWLSQSISIPNSELTQHYLNLYFKEVPEPVYWLPKIPNQNNILPKIYDLIFISSDIYRYDKNFSLCLEIFEKLPHLNKVLIGRHSSKINLPNTLTLEFVPNHIIYDYLKQSKVLLITSIKDAGPGVFYQAILSHCTPLISYNCGQAKIQHKPYRYALDFEASNWIKTIDDLLQVQPYCFDSEYFYHLINHFNASKYALYQYISSFLPLPQSIDRSTTYSLAIINKYNNTHIHKYTQNMVYPTYILDQVEDLFKLDLKTSHVLIMNDNVLLYNWTTISNYHKTLPDLLQKCVVNDGLNILRVYNSLEKILLLPSKNIDLYSFVSDKYNYKLSDINGANYHSLGVDVNLFPIDTMVDFGILYLHQFDQNVFEKYILHLLQNVNFKINIFIYYGQLTCLGRFEYHNSNCNIMYVNEDNIAQVIQRYGTKKLYIPYLPLEFIVDKTQFKLIMDNDGIEKYVFLGGIISHMYKYVNTFNIKKTIGLGTKYKLFFPERETVHYSLWEYPQINQIKQKIVNCELKQRNSIPKLKKTFVNIGRLSIEKNLIFLVEAFYQFINEIEDNEYKLYIIGSSPSKALNDSIHDFIRMRNLEHNIIVKSWMNSDELYNFCSQEIDYHITTSVSEGLSGVVLETMTLGIPSIAGNVYCINDLIEHNYNGLLFEYHDYNNIIMHKSYNSAQKLNYEINLHIAQNIKNLVKVFKQTVHNYNLYHKLSLNCLNYINHHYQRKNHINYYDLFDLKLDKSDKSVVQNKDSRLLNLFIISFNVDLETQKSCQKFSSYYTHYNQEFDLNLFKQTLQNDYLPCSHILLVTHDLTLLTEYKYGPGDYYISKIQPYLSDSHLGTYFLTQNLMYGSASNICIYNRRILNQYLDNFDRNPKIFELKTNFNQKYRYINQYIGYYRITNPQQEIQNVIQNIKENNFLNIEYISEAFRKYNLTSIEDFKNWTEPSNDTFIPLETILSAIKLNEIVPTAYSHSKFNFGNKPTYFEIESMSVHDKILFSQIISVNTGDHSNRTVNYEFAFVYCHYLSNNNFERNICYYYRKLKEQKKSVCIIMPRWQEKTLNIILSSYFDYDDIIFVNHFNLHEIKKLQSEYGLNHIYFIDTILSNLSLSDLIEIKFKSTINLFLCGLINWFNQFLIQNNSYHSIFDNIISNSRAHQKLLTHYRVRIHQFRDFREDKSSLNLKNQLSNRICYIGRYHCEKQCRMIFDAFLNLSQKYPETTFNFYGNFGDELNNCQNILDEHNITNIHIHYQWLNTNEVNDIIKQHDYIVQNSISEGNPTIIWEAFKNSIPVICSNIYGNNDIVICDQNGFLYNLEGYDLIKNDLNLTYVQILNHLKPYYDINRQNLEVCIEKALNLDLKTYTVMQQQCYSSWLDYRNSELNIKDLFNIKNLKENPRILILTDGCFYNGGYATLAKKISDILKQYYQSVDVRSFVFNGTVDPSYQIRICPNNPLDFKRYLIQSIKDYNLIICTSPWSFYGSSHCSTDIPILYIKGGGLCSSSLVIELHDTSIINANNIENYYDPTTLKLENEAMKKLTNYKIIPTTEMMKQITLNMGKHFQMNPHSLSSSISYFFFDKYIMYQKPKKTYDLIIVISNHSRHVKNSPFLFYLYSLFPNCNKIVIGENCQHYESIPNTKVINQCVDHDHIYNYYLQSKITLIGSYVDIGPSTYIEALVRGCIPIAYRNCGFSQIDKHGIQCQTLSSEEWVPKINNLLLNYDSLNLLNLNKNINILIDSDKNKIQEIIDSFKYSYN